MTNIPIRKPVVKAKAPTKIDVSSGVIARNKLGGMTPQYPRPAKAAGIQGTVVLQADISTDGHVGSLKVLSGPPLLQESALEAVKTWRYRPYLVNGKPVEVATQIDVIFTLGGG